MATRLGLVDLLLGREWLAALNRRFKAGLIYLGSEAVFCLTLALWSGKAAFALYWTFWNAESGYVWWHEYFNLHPLREFLIIALATGTARNAAWWFIVFRGEGALLELPFVRKRFNLDRYPGLREKIQRHTTHPNLFLAGVTPWAYPFGYLAQRENPIRLGVATILLGNAVKLTAFAVIYYLTGSNFVVYVAIGAVVITKFLPQILERLLPNHRRRWSSRAHRPH